MNVLNIIHENLSNALAVLEDIPEQEGDLEAALCEMMDYLVEALAVSKEGKE